MSAFERRLKIGKTDVYTLDVASWSDGEPIVSFSVVTDALTTAGITQIDGSQLSVLLTGVSAGNSVVEFIYSTSTRNDCYESTVIVIDAC